MSRGSKRRAHEPTESYPSGHRLSAADLARGRIRCDGDCCREPAEFCEYSRFTIPTRTPTRGISFYYYCAACWRKPSGNMATAPEQRAMVVVAVTATGYRKFTVEHGGKP